MSALVGVAACISAVGGATAAVITALNRRTANVIEQKTDAQSAVIEAHGEDLDHIRTNVDGALTASVNRAMVAEGQNEQLTQARMRRRRVNSLIRPLVRATLGGDAPLGAGKQMTNGPSDDTQPTQTP